MSQKNVKDSRMIILYHILIVYNLHGFQSKLGLV